MADGSFVNSRLQLSLSSKDELHVGKFREFVGANGTGNYYQIRDTKRVPYLMKKFGIKRNKTYNPPIKMCKKMLSNPSLFVSFLIGLIDGDGCICRQSGGRKDCFIKIKMHSSWKSYLARVNSKMGSLLNLPIGTIVTKKYTEMRLCNSITNIV